MSRAKLSGLGLIPILSAMVATAGLAGAAVGGASVHYLDPSPSLTGPDGAYVAAPINAFLAG